MDKKFLLEKKAICKFGKRYLEKVCQVSLQYNPKLIFFGFAILVEIHVSDNFKRKLKSLVSCMLLIKSLIIQMIIQTIIKKIQVRNTFKCSQNFFYQKGEHFIVYSSGRMKWYMGFLLLMCIMCYYLVYYMYYSIDKIE